MIAVVLFAFWKISLKSLIMSALPISTSQYWFATCYVILLLISPALQIFIHNVDRKIYRRILIVLFVLFDLLFHRFIRSTWLQPYGMVYISIFISWIHKNISAKYADRINVLYSMLVYGILVVFAVITSVYGYNIPFFRENAKYLYAEMNTVTAITCSILLFLSFR